MRTGLLILNIIAFVLSIPASFCSYMCAGMTTEMAGEGGITQTLAGMTIGIWFFCFVAFILGFIAFAKPKTVIAVISGIVLIIAGIIMMALIVTGNLLGVITGIMYVIAGVFAIAAKKPIKE